MRKIICAETGEVFDSISEATECLTGSRYKSNIREALSNPARENRAYNFTWYYMDSSIAQIILASKQKEREVM